MRFFELASRKPPAPDKKARMFEGCPQQVREVMHVEVRSCAHVQSRTPDRIQFETATVTYWRPGQAVSRQKILPEAPQPPRCGSPFPLCLSSEWLFHLRAVQTACSQRARNLQRRLRSLDRVRLAKLRVPCPLSTVQELLSPLPGCVGRQCSSDGADTRIRRARSGSAVGRRQPGAQHLFPVGLAELAAVVAVVYSATSIRPLVLAS